MGKVMLSKRWTMWSQKTLGMLMHTMNMKAMDRQVTATMANDVLLRLRYAVKSDKVRERWRKNYGPLKSLEPNSKRR